MVKEVVGGIIVLYSGEKVHNMILDVKQKFEDLKSSLPEGIEIVTTYD
ncbi:hypothetical protein MASR2M36_10230 [Providencia sp.]